MSITGVDIPISLIRDDFANNLWTDVDNKIYYARAFRNERLIKGDKQLIPEVYDSGKEYKEVMFDNKWNVSVFFDVDPQRTNVGDQPTTTISAIFAVNLEALYPNETFRPEENAHADVLQIFDVSRSSYSIQTIDLVSGLDAYGDFYRDNVMEYNMHPWHTFRLDLETTYYYDCSDSQYFGGGGFEYPFPIIFNT